MVGKDSQEWEFVTGAVGSVGGGGGGSCGGRVAAVAVAVAVVAVAAAGTCARLLGGVVGFEEIERKCNRRDLNLQ